MNTATVIDSSSTAVESEQKNLRLLVYLYVMLWVGEGALRKWIVPGLSSPLLLIRDPVLLAIYIGAFRHKLPFFNTFTSSILLLGGLSTLVGLGLPEAPPLKVIAFGIHANFLHLPLIFLLPQILKYKHVRFLGILFLWMAIPMALLVALQFLSPSMGRLNAGAGGNDGGMLETAGGRIRPSGTFSFTNGMAGFSALIGSFLLHQLLERTVFPKIAFLTAAPALIVMVLLSGSRTTFGLIVLLLMTVAAIWIIQPRYMKSSLKFFAIGFVIISLVGSFSVLRLGMSVLAERFGDKKNVREGFVMRFIGEFEKPFATVAKAEPFGVGIGMGTNAASSMIYGKVRFNFGESDWDRIINEMGPLLGVIHILWRMAAAIFVVRQCILSLRENGNTLPLLLCTAGLPDLILGQLGQATTLGYACLTAGLALAAARRGDETSTEAEIAALTPISRPLARSRSIYSEQLIAENERTPAAISVVDSFKQLRERSAYTEVMPLALIPTPTVPPKKRGRSKAVPKAKELSDSKDPTPKKVRSRSPARNVQASSRKT